MSRNHFEEILNCISYTSNNPPETLHRFWEVRELIGVWNKNMGEMFITSWINTINESMSKWLNEYTCPGFMCVPRTPWRFGNEYHDAGCALSDIICGRDDRIPSTTPADPPRDAKDSGSARSHSTHLETSSSNRP